MCFVCEEGTNMGEVIEFVRGYLLLHYTIDDGRPCLGGGSAVSK